MGIEQGSTNRWKTARERNRLKARYIIHSRVISHVSSSNNNKNEDDNNNQTICTTSSSSSSTKSSVNETEKELKIILQYMQSVIKNDVSSFSVVALVRDGQLLNGPLPSSLHSYHDTVNLHSQFQLKNAFSNMLSTSTMSFTTYRTTTTNDDTNNQELLLQPITLAASKFGTEYVIQRLVPYMEYLKNKSGRQLTLIEYASLLGRHSIVSLLLLGGLDPTITSFNNNNNGKARSWKVLSRFHCLNGEEVIPLTIWSYIVRAIIEMRINGALVLQYDQKVGQDSETTTSSSTMLCTLCNNNEVCHLLHFGPPCHHHTYCEPCMWEHLMDGLSNNCTQLQRNVVTCPICEAEFDGFQYCQQQRCHSSRRRTKETEDKACEQISNNDDEKKDDKTAMLPPMNELSIQNSGNDHEGTKMMQGIAIQTIEQRKQRRLESFDKFMKLPATSTALKSKKNKSSKQKKRDAAHGTWEEALRQQVQTNQSKEVRVDRFFRAILSSPHLVASYLEAGIDVNIKNVYGQTPLYIACWKGKLMTVQLLLEYDADPTVAANGGSTCYSVAKKFARVDVLELLERYCAVDDYANSKVGIDIPTNLVMTGNDYNYQVSTLIDPTLDHPGAGACIIDNALTEVQLQYLDNLWQSLPVADVCDDDEVGTDVASIKGVQSLNSASDGSNGNSENYEHYRPSRSYFCDSEEVVQNMLAECVQAARLSTLPSSSKESNDIASTAINNKSPPSSVLKHLRFLNYERPGGILPPHVDLCRIDDESGYRSTHTFILYLTDCEHGGGTALLQCLKHPEVISIAKPRRGRVLIFPHLCPHSGLETVSPKLLLRGEVII